MTLVFVYGTLKRGCKNHHLMAGHAYLGEARTKPGFRLCHLGDYPGMVPDAADREGVTGEVWRVDAASLARLDAFEGVPDGYYRRDPVPLEPPFDGREVHAYLYALATDGLPRIGPTWVE